jgi:hypothetical protein
MEHMREFMQRDDIIPGFGDGGAHGTIIQDTVGASHSLTHWVRGRELPSVREPTAPCCIRNLHTAPMQILYMIRSEQGSQTEGKTR